MRVAVITASALLAAAALVAGFAGCEGEDSVALPPIAGAHQGAGCDATVPAGFPYQPGCCGYAVDVPELEASGFDDGLVSSGAPDHVHVSYAGPAESTFAVNWRAPIETTATQLLYGTDRAAVEAADGPGEGVSLVRGHHMLYGSLLGASGETRVHEVHVCGLEAGTTYYYKVGGPDAFSAVYDVATAPEPGSTDAFRFAVTGDSRDEPAIFAEIEQAVHAEGVDFQLFTGDLVNIGANQDHWNAWFESSSGNGGFAAETALATIPFMTINGNHDNLTVNYVAQFALPQQLTETELAQGEEWWSFDYGNAHIIGLNDTPVSSGTGAAQLGWLNEDLAAVDREKTPWIFAIHHRSTYSCGGSHGSDLKLRAAWQPIFDEHKVDVVFSGHDHLYERSKPMRGLSGTDGKVAEAAPDGAPVAGSGTVFVVSGGAGAPLYGAEDGCEHTLFTESVRNYVIVEVEDRTLRYAAYRDDGSILDQFEYSK